MTRSPSSIPKYYDILKHRREGASNKMRDYANVIAKHLHLPTPNFDSFDETHEFIKKNARTFRKDRVDKYISYASGKRPQAIKWYTDELLKNGFKGIYLFWNEDDLVYIGKATVSASRVLSSFNTRKYSIPITHISVIKLENVADIHVLEPLLICENNPLLNREFSCGITPSMVSSNIDVHSLKKIKVEEVEYKEESNQLV